MRKSSVHFKQVANASVSIAHSTRTEETEPAYLLPKEHRLGNVIVPGSMSNIELGLEFTRAKSSMTGQAKARGSSPFWEGVVVLDGTDLKAQTAALQEWKKDYEKATGQRVLHMAIHGDEGYIDEAGEVHYNMHAHVIVNRLNDKGRVIKLGRAQLSAVQDLTATSLDMQRGETLKDRNYMRGRKHMNHREFRRSENEKRLEGEKKDTQIEKAVRLSDRNISNVINANAKIKALTEENERYKAERVELKESGIATLQDYQRIKKEHEQEVAKLKQAYDDLKAEAIEIIKPLNEKVEKMSEEITQLTTDNARLVAEATAKRAENASYRPTQSELKAVDAVLIEQARERMQASELAFIAQHPSLKSVDISKIDGYRLDAAEGRLGLFSTHAGASGRTQVLCKVPINRVMPDVGALFDSRAVPGQSKNGIAD